MLRAIATGTALALLAHAVRYRWRLARMRADDGRRHPVGADGIVPGAHAIMLSSSETHAVLVIHGFGDTPQSVRLLCEYLHGVRGWTVRAPLLPGHGRTLADFDAAGSDTWRDAVASEYDALATRYRTVTLVGQSMGGALATLIAAGDPALPALVLLVPYLTAPARAQRLAPLAGVVNLLVPYLQGGDRVQSIFDAEARGLTLGAGAVPPKRIRDLVAVANDARLAAGDVRAPTLLIHSRTDYRISVALAERHRGYFTGTGTCEQRWVEGSGHVIAVDYCRESVWADTGDWLARYAGAPPASASSQPVGGA
jgi:carboxylesterase